jgi:ketosteroid isomerase-like protein
VSGVPTDRDSFDRDSFDPDPPDPDPPDPDPPDPEPPDLDPPDLDIVRRAIDAMGDLDIDTVFELLAAEFVLELPFRGDGGPRRMEGDAARAFMRALPKLLREMPFSDIVVHGALPTGEIVAEYRSEGITTAGRDYSNTYVAFLSVADGRITRWREFFDPNVVAAAFPLPA